MNTTTRTTIRTTIRTVALVVCVGTATPAVAIPVPEPDTHVSSTQTVETDLPSGHQCFPLVRLPGQEWLPARRVG
ncbi:hypothetical protein ACFQW6_10025 [Nocardioides sp. GCM10028917]|uniref:hypothetical protein n=1 Tax=Nocardioides sp. GCM10028917 TaxID=3273408 RepID=UPI00360DF8EE